MKRKSTFRFSPFVKSGTEAYLLNTTKLVQKPSTDLLEIVVRLLILVKLHAILQQNSHKT